MRTVPHNNTQKTNPSTFILVLLISYAAVSAVLFTPALPEIMQALGANHAGIQLTVAIFLLGYAFGQLIYGPLANRFGRKNALYIGFSMALFGDIISLVACLSGSLLFLVLGRFITALGACSGYALTCTIINEHYELAQARKILATAVLSFAIAPGVSIAIGGFLAVHFGWQSIFMVMTAYGALLLFLITKLPETAKYIDPKALQVKKIIQQYSAVLRNQKFILYGLACTAWSALLYLYYADAPFIAAHDFHFSTEKYGAVSLITAAGYFIGNLLSRKLATMTTAQKAIKVGLMTIALGLMVLSLMVFNIIYWQYLYFIAVAICFAGGAMVFSNAVALGLHQASDVASSSSMFGFISVLGGMLCTSSLGYFSAPHVGMFFAIYLCIYLCLAGFNFWAEQVA
jgi:MFS transporter, DHA1 family, multidrug resistance protein